MRYLTAACPDFSRVLLVESGSRAVMEKAIPRLRNALGPKASFELITCHAGSPFTLDAAARAWRTQDYVTRGDRSQLLRALAGYAPTVVVMICSGEAIMLRWKWWLAWKLPAKVLIVNENSDFFWLDTTNLRVIRRLVLIRLGLSGNVAGPTLLRLVLLPLTVAYLVLYATIVHVRRAIFLASAARIKTAVQ